MPPPLHDKHPVSLAKGLEDAFRADKMRRVGKVSRLPTNTLCAKRRLTDCSCVFALQEAPAKASSNQLFVSKVSGQAFKGTSVPVPNFTPHARATRSDPAPVYVSGASNSSPVTYAQQIFPAWASSGAHDLPHRMDDLHSAPAGRTHDAGTASLDARGRVAERALARPKTQPEAQPMQQHVRQPAKPGTGREFNIALGIGNALRSTSPPASRQGVADRKIPPPFAMQARASAASRPVRRNTLPSRGCRAGILCFFSTPTLFFS